MVEQGGHIFSQHLLRPLNTSPVVNNTNELYWPSVYVLLGLALIVLVKRRAQQRISRVVQSTFSLQVLQQLGREESYSMRVFSLALNMFFLANLAFLLYKLNSLNGFALGDTPPLAQYMFFLLVLVILYMLRRVVNFLLGVITNQRRLLADYLIRCSLVNQTFGLVLFPVAVLLEFTDLPVRGPLVAGLVIVGVSFLLRWYRGFMLGSMEERVGLLQIFTYFCGLEILPVLVVVKYLVETL